MDNLKSLSEITSCLDEKISGIISENSDSKNEFRTIITDLREIVTNNKEKIQLDIKISNIRDERNRKRTGIILGK